jgi:hypothetical protein
LPRLAVEEPTGASGLSGPQENANAGKVVLHYNAILGCGFYGLHDPSFAASGGRGALNNGAIMNRRSLAVALAVLTCLSPVAAFSQTAGEPKLTIVDPSRTAGEIVLSIADIEKLGTTVVKTSTPWHNGVQTFEGVSLEKLASSMGMKGTTLVVKALNNYMTEIPFTDLAKFPVILAYKRNGELMPINDKGPFFVIYSYDANPALKSEVYYSRSAWQVKSIAVE